MDLYDADTGSLLPRWFTQAACVDADPAAFFPDKGEDVGPAQAICANCPVRRDCLQLAITEGHKDGVWGGLSARERARLAADAA